MLAIASPVLAVAVAGCGAPKPITRLDCPEKHGALSRVSASADGQACAYRATDGTDVDLRLLALAAGPAAALRPIEAQLSREAAPNVAKSPPTEEKETIIALPGLHVRARGDSAEVNVGPVKIDASGDNAVVRLQREVRLKGQSLSPSRNGFRATFVLAGDDLIQRLPVRRLRGGRSEDRPAGRGDLQVEGRRSHPI